MHDRIQLRGLSNVACFVMIAGVIGIGGCSNSSDRPKTIPVSGTVKVNGAPVPNVSVTFITRGKSPRNPTGITDSQGRYQLTSFEANDGAVAGDYIVTVVPAGSVSGKKPEQMSAQDMINLGPGGGLKKADTIPAKYTDPQSSDLKRSIVAGEVNVFDFDLK